MKKKTRRIAFCACCRKERPWYGSEYYVGDICRCEDCRWKGVEMPAYARGSRFEGILGITVD